MSTPRWSLEGRDWPNRAHSRFVDTGRMRWHVQSFGAEDAPVIVLLHGTGAATHSWRTLAPLLGDRFRVVAPDLPGHGFTSGRPAGGLSMRGVAGAVGDLLRTMKLVPHAIVGHSAGAAVAIRMTLDGVAAPSAIVGLSSALLPFPGLAAKLFPGLARALFVNPFAPRLFAQMARLPGETGRFLRRSTGSHIDATGERCYETLFATSSHCAGAITMMADWDLESLARDLPHLKARLLLVHGDRDTAIPLASARQAAGKAGARLEVLEGLGHLAHEERPDLVATAIRAFVEEP
ncbi:alpha/beta fold hydrolase [Sphingomonas ginsenosidivorax]|uniref:Alpha/beta fold hydrolase n=1 Tax=Sphingomonas ginsenosidivorax TaxID=862135 RepID=A0A5C6UER4_9SPHN|nr:alpha/beta fold hydrolase BchO [Sphingomonas ginsenosidivorax]TXC71189.1 alpha/beta fold hydrolase [Sphingomonas ginsenosidivorax]